jgi:lysophospholipase L1-like esterase
MILKTTLILFGCALIIVLVFHALRMRQLIRIGTDLANAAVPYEQAPTEAAERVLFIGDSSAVGTGASDPTLTTAGRYGAEHPQAEVLNLGVNGSKTHELIPRLDALEGESFDLIVIQIGGNDIVRLTPTDEHEESLRGVLERAQGLTDTIVLLHSGNVGTSPFFPFGTRWIWTRKTRAVRDMYLRVAPEYGARYVDLFAEKGEDRFALDPDRFYAPDNFHPSEEGYRVWYEEIENVLAQELP